MRGDHSDHDIENENENSTTGVADPSPTLNTRSPTPDPPHNSPTIIPQNSITSLGRPLVPSVNHSQKTSIAPAPTQAPGTGPPVLESPPLPTKENAGLSGDPEDAILSGATSTTSRVTSVTSDTRGTTLLDTSSGAAFTSTSANIVPTNSIGEKPTSPKGPSNHSGIIAGVASVIVIVCILLVALAVRIVRGHRAKRLDRGGVTEDDEGRHSLRVHRVDSILVFGTHPAADSGDIDTLSQYSETSSNGTLGQPAMSVGESENYPPSLYPASTLPAYATTQRSLSPPAYSDLSMRQSQDTIPQHSNLKQG